MGGPEAEWFNGCLDVNPVSFGSHIFVRTRKLFYIETSHALLLKACAMILQLLNISPSHIHKFVLEDTCSGSRF